MNCRNYDGKRRKAGRRYESDGYGQDPIDLTFSGPKCLDILEISVHVRVEV